MKLKVEAVKLKTVRTIVEWYSVWSAVQGLGWQRPRVWCILNRSKFECKLRRNVYAEYVNVQSRQIWRLTRKDIPALSSERALQNWHCCSIHRLKCSRCQEVLKTKTDRLTSRQSWCNFDSYWEISVLWTLNISQAPLSLHLPVQMSEVAFRNLKIRTVSCKSDERRQKNFAAQFAPTYKKLCLFDVCWTVHHCDNWRITTN